MNMPTLTKSFGFFPLDTSQLSEQTTPANFLKLIFPGYLKHTRRIRICQWVKRALKNQSAWDISPIFKGNTRLLSHVSDQIYHNHASDHAHHCTQAILERNVTDTERQAFFHEYPELFTKEFIAKFDLLGFDFWMFETGIFFVTINLRLSHECNTEENFFWRRHLLKRLLHLPQTKSFIEQILKDSRFFVRSLPCKQRYVQREDLPFSFFEEQLTDDGGNPRSTTRAILFSSFLLKESTPSTNIEDLHIPYWYAGVSDVLSNNLSSIRSASNIEEYCFLPSVKLIATAAGCCLCGLPADKNTQKYLKKGYSSFYQHALLEYIMLLHQSYYLILIKKDLMLKKRTTGFDRVRDRYVQYLSKYLLNIVSTENKYQILYECIQKNLHIKSASKEINLNVTPLTDRAFVKKERLQNIFLAILALLTFITGMEEFFNVCKALLQRLLTFF